MLACRFQSDVHGRFEQGFGQCAPHHQAVDQEAGRAVDLQLFGIVQILGDDPGRLVAGGVLFQAVAGSVTVSPAAVCSALRMNSVLSMTISSMKAAYSVMSWAKPSAEVILLI